MGLTKDFLTMLTATVTLKRASGTDAWGNETYDAPTLHPAFIDPGSTSLGSGEEGGQREGHTVTRRQVITDALGIKPTDILAFDGIDHTVTEVNTVKDEFGDDLYQTLSVEDQKKG